MSYDWHFSDGSHKKMSSMSVHTAIMLVYHAMGVWSDDRLESELTTMLMHKNDMDKKYRSQDAKKKAEKGAKRQHIIISIEKVDLDSDFYKAAMKAGMPVEERDGVAYLAKVEFKGERPTKEFMKDFSKNMEPHLKFAIRNTMRCDELRNDAPKKFKSTFEKVLCNDGLIFDRDDSHMLMGAFLALNEKHIEGLGELVVDGWQEFVLACAYVGAKDLTAKIL